MGTKIKIKQIANHKDMVIVNVVGELDHTSNYTDSIYKEIIPLLEKGVIFFVFNLSELSYIDSTGILNLLYCFLKVKKIKGEIKFVGVSDRVKEIFESIGITKFISLYSNVAEAINSFGKNMH